MDFRKGYDPKNHVFDSSQLSEFAYSFNFFKIFPGFPEFLAYPAGKVAAAHYAIKKAKKAGSEPLILSGNINEKVLNIRRGIIGHYINNSTVVPVDEAFLGKRSGFAWKFDGRLFLPPRSFEKVNLEDLV